MSIVSEYSDCGCLQGKERRMGEKEKNRLWNECFEEITEEQKPKKQNVMKWIVFGVGLVAVLAILVFVVRPKDIPAGDENLPDWGLTLSVKDVTPSGMTLVCTQSGGQFTEEFGSLITGESYYLVKIKNKRGKLVPTVIKDYGFNAIAYIVPLNTDTEFKIDWEWLYGELKPGTYRLVKGFTEMRENGNHIDAEYWVEFVIE